MASEKINRILGNSSKPKDIIAKILEEEFGKIRKAALKKDKVVEDLEDALPLAGNFRVKDAIMDAIDFIRYSE